MLTPVAKPPFGGHHFRCVFPGTRLINLLAQSPTRHAELVKQRNSGVFQ